MSLKVCSPTAVLCSTLLGMLLMAASPALAVDDYFGSGRIKSSARIGVVGGAESFGLTSNLRSWLGADVPRVSDSRGEELEPGSQPQLAASGQPVGRTAMGQVREFVLACATSMGMWTRDELGTRFTLRRMHKP